MKRFLFGLILALCGEPLRADGPIAPDGKTQVQIDLPLPLRMFNVGGSDGNGLCVYTSVTHAALYQGEARLYGLRAWAQQRPGGSWPEKLEKDRQTFAPDAPMLQYEGRDPAFLRAALQAGLLPSVTWTRAHMLNLVYLDDNLACILDNNSAYGTAADGTRTDTRLQWMTAQRFLAKWAQGGSGWAVVLLAKGPPPPVPVNGLPATPTWHAPRYEWRRYASDPGDLYLFRDDQLRGGWRKGNYHAYDSMRPSGKRWSFPTQPPVAVPAPPPVAQGTDMAAVWVTDGGCRWHSGRGAERYTLNGQQIDAATALQLVTKWTSTPRLTVIGDDAFRATVLADLAGPLKWWGDRLLIQDYAADNPLVANVGLGPGISLQPPPGADGTAKVLFRLRSYPGPAILAAALRQKAPGYDPSKDPDPTAPPPPAANPLTLTAADWQHYAPFGVLSVILALVLIVPGRQPPAPTPVSEIEQWIPSL